LRTVMSSIIRWRKGETLRAVRMGIPRDVVSLMGSNRTRKLARTIALGNPAYIDDGREKKSRTTGFPRSGLVHSLISVACPLAKLVKDTIWHEVTRYFGMSELRVRAAGRKRRQ